MTENEAKIKIKTLRETIKLLEKEILKLEKEIVCKDEKKMDKSISYYDYLINVKGLREHTANNYLCHLRGIKTRLRKYDNVLLKCEIYDISDIEMLKQIKTFIEKSERIKIDNKKQHNAFSAAFNNYMNYRLGFYNKEQEIPSEFILDE